METPSFYQPAVYQASPPLLLTAEVKLPSRVIEYGYDGLSRRIRKKTTETAYYTPGTTAPAPLLIAVWEAYVYDGWNLILNVKLNPATGASQGRPQALNANYVWGPDLGSKPFARRDWQAAGGVRGLLMAIPSGGSQIQLPIHDPMGNIVQVIRATYGFYSSTPTTFRTDFVYDYDAFGKETRSSSLVAGLNPDSFPFHYSTKFMDPETGFNYYGYRFYDPNNGRWLNRDPIGEDGGLNIYEMVGNSAVNNFDRLGLETGIANPRSPMASVEQALTNPSTASETMQMMKEIAGGAAAGLAIAAAETASQRSTRKKLCEKITAKKKAAKTKTTDAGAKRNKRHKEIGRESGKQKEELTQLCHADNAYCEALENQVRAMQNELGFRQDYEKNECDDFAGPEPKMHPEEMKKLEDAKKEKEANLNECIKNGYKIKILR